MAKMEKIGLHHAVLLQATYGPKPYWTKANPEVSIGDTCQTLYAVDIGNSMGYTLALVRRCDRDYPILLGMGSSSNHIDISSILIIFVSSGFDGNYIFSSHGFRSNP